GPGHGAGFLREQAGLRSSHGRKNGQWFSMADRKREGAAGLADHIDEGRRTQHAAGSRKDDSRSAQHRENQWRSAANERLPQDLRRAEGQRRRIPFTAERTVLRDRSRP